jgi:hypothetical protein
MSESLKLETLNTSYVNLAALIRYLREKEFTGRLHIVLDQYEADVTIYGSSEPSAWENDHAAGRESQGEAALQRLLVRAREPGGVITIWKDPVETTSSSAANVSAQVPVGSSSDVGRESVAGERSSDVVAASAEVINSVRRAVESMGVSFTEHFRFARIDIGDDYPFLDPTVGGFDYEDSKVNLQAVPGDSVYIQGITEALKRVVDRVARDQGGDQIREAVARELTTAASNGLGQFARQLDRIAGTRIV